MFSGENMIYRNDLIRSKIVNKDLNISSFAEKSGLGLNTARKLWNGETNLELSSLEKASDFLEIPLHILFAPAEQAAQVATNN